MLEEILIRHSAPTLAGLKTANLFWYSWESKEEFENSAELWKRVLKEKGLEPLAAYMMLQQAKEPLEETAKQYISEEKEVKTEEEAIAGAKDIIAEIISDNADYRTWIRKTTMKKGKVVSTAKDPETESV